MLSRNDCVLKTSGNFKITSLVARYSLSCPVQPITSSLISPLGIVPLLESLIITARSYEAHKYYSNTQYTNIISIFSPLTRHFLPLDIIHSWAVMSSLPLTSYAWCAPSDCCCHYAMWHRSRGRELAPPTPAWSLDRGPGGQGLATRGQWYDGITRLNNVRIMGLKPRLSMGSLGITQTVKLLGFLHFQMLAPSLRPAPPSLAIFSLVFSSTIKYKLVWTLPPLEMLQMPVLGSQINSKCSSCS